VEGKGGVKGIGASQKRARTDNEIEGDGVDGAPQLEPHETGAVEDEGGVEGIGALQKHARMDDELISPSRGIVTKVN
jgi:hypothetical protein